MEICVLHTGWKSEEGKERWCGYALLERRANGKIEYAIRCFWEGGDGSIRCWIHPHLASNCSAAYAVLYRLACAKASPLHVEDILNDMGL
ncbi:MAG: hypothetical protein PHE47_06850 [Oscillospiraceae bacterium]|nr:hypothetical protein [Oscillospiraceae bacterium]